MKIEEFTICLHCGCNRDITNDQINALRPLEDKYKVYWNNRIDRFPGFYPSYSQLINHSIATSHTEWVILINDRTSPTVDEVEKMLDLLESGMSCVFLYNVGFMGFAKELIRKIGWWDEGFIHGGWEDRDWVWRLAEANLSLYESQESTYDYTWKSPLNVPGGNSSTPHWRKKWAGSSYDHVIRVLPEQTYQHWDLFLGASREDISNTWTSWSDSNLDIDFGGPGSGPSGSQLLANRKIISAT
jgi:hypothetical protein